MAVSSYFGEESSKGIWWSWLGRYFVVVDGHLSKVANDHHLWKNLNGFALGTSFEVAQWALFLSFKITRWKEAQWSIGFIWKNIFWKWLNDISSGDLKGDLSKWLDGLLGRFKRNFFKAAQWVIFIWLGAYLSKKLDKLVTDF